MNGTPEEQGITVKSAIRDVFVPIIYIIGIWCARELIKILFGSITPIVLRTILWSLDLLTILAISRPIIRAIKVFISDIRPLIEWFSGTPNPQNQLVSIQIKELMLISFLVAMSFGYRFLGPSYVNLNLLELLIFPLAGSFIVVTRNFIYVWKKELISPKAFYWCVLFLIGLLILIIMFTSTGFLDLENQFLIYRYFITILFILVLNNSEADINMRQQLSCLSKLQRRSRNVHHEYFYNPYFARSVFIQS